MRATRIWQAVDIVSLRASRRLAWVLFIVVASGCDPGTNGNGADADAPTGPLRDLAARCGIRIGAAVAHPPLTGEPLYGETLAREFSSFTPENEMKWSFIHPQQSQYDFDRVDALVAFAASNNMVVHGHTLVWHNQNPEWLVSGGFSRSQMIDILRDHVHTVVGRYAGRYLTSWDVVNEAVNDDGTLRQTVWLDRIGPEYIDLAFQFANQADPAARLIYNDYENEGVNAKSTAIYTLVAGMRGRGVPIHGVGFQLHITTAGIDVQSVVQNMQRFAALGLDVYVTELDVRTGLPATPGALATQAGVYRDVLNACLGQRACKQFHMWGFTDAHSWIPGSYPGFGAALPFDEHYQSKPAYDAISERLRAC
jgi:endo-1,4-beta-xylanase